MDRPGWTWTRRLLRPAPATLRGLTIAWALAACSDASGEATPDPADRPFPPEEDARGTGNDADPTDAAPADASASDAANQDAASDDTHAGDAALSDVDTHDTDPAPTDTGAGPPDADSGDTGPSDTNTDPVDAGHDAPDLDGAGLDADGGDVSDAWTRVRIEGRVLLSNSFPNQIHALYRPLFTSGSGLARVRLFARFCADAACEETLGWVRAQVDGEDTEGRRVLSTASTSGEGFAASFVLDRAPLGESWMQLVADPELRQRAGLGACSTESDCPGPLALVMTDAARIEAVDALGRTNPPPSTERLEVTAADDEHVLSGPRYLGHLAFSRPVRYEPAPPGEGRVMVGASNAEGTYRNTLFTLDVGAIAAGSGGIEREVVLQRGDGPFRGDVCGAIPGPDALWVVGVDEDGAHVFELDPADGAQRSAEPTASIAPPSPDDPSTWPWPCRGAWTTHGERGQLVLAQFRGAGSLNTSGPWPLYRVDLNDGTVTTPFADRFGDWAIRSLAWDASTGAVFGLEMSWSLDARTTGVESNRVLRFDLREDGSLAEPRVASATHASDERCDSTLQWPTALAILHDGDTPRLVVGHDAGVAVHDLETLSELHSLALPAHGRLFTPVQAASPGEWLAVPQCKALSSESRFRLPLGAGDETADSNLIAVLAWDAGAPRPSGAELDIDGDGRADRGVDLDFYDLKAWIRSFSSSAVIPPVVFTGASVAASGDYLVVRGSGVQGVTGGGVESSSGLGQVSDLGVLDRRTGHGLLLRDYNPFLDGPSARWGFPLRPPGDASTGFVVPLALR